ncbi:MAG TPA: winged helix-turn-helix transcriptional regulator [Nitrososphaeraceae archaeon]|nr:winged helix-turn-helix transcriptional regulator [Nitrososphaeraceae archaeon]
MINKQGLTNFYIQYKGNNPKTLSIRLKKMEKMGMIERTVFQNETPIRIEYYPTTKKGERNIFAINYRDDVRANSK